MAETHITYITTNQAGVDMSATTKQPVAVGTADAAKILGKRQSEVKHMLLTGVIPCFKTPRGHYRILVADLLKKHNEAKSEGEAQPETLTPAQASSMLGVSRPTVTQMAKEGLLPYTQTLGGHRRILREDVELYMARSRAKARLKAIKTIERMKKKEHPAIEEKQGGETKSP